MEPKIGVDPGVFCMEAQVSMEGAHDIPRLILDRMLRESRDGNDPSGLLGEFEPGDLLYILRLHGIA